MTNVLNARDLVAMQVKHIKLGKILEVSYLFNLVLPEHKYSQRRNCVQLRDLFNLVVIQVKENQVRKTD